jgi:hypothetical protein
MKHHSSTDCVQCSSGPYRGGGGGGGGGGGVMGPGLRKTFSSWNPRKYEQREQ